MKEVSFSGTEMIANLDGFDHLFGIGNDSWLLTDPSNEFWENAGFLPVWADAVWHLDANVPPDTSISVFAVTVDEKDKSVKSVDVLNTVPGQGFDLALVAGDAVLFGAAAVAPQYILETGITVLAQNESGALRLGIVSGAGQPHLLDAPVVLSSMSGAMRSDIIDGSDVVSISFSPNAEFPDIEMASVLAPKHGPDEFLASVQVGDADDEMLTGGDGPDTLIGLDGQDLLAGSGIGSEWTLEAGRWIYTPAAVVQTHDNMNVDAAADVLAGGDGNDVLLGNWGHDTLYGGDGDDIVNGGWGADVMFGGAQADTLNLENGHDVAWGGLGADILNAGIGNDTLYGDQVTGDIVSISGVTTFDDMSIHHGWTTETEGSTQILSRNLSVEDGQTYSVSFGAGANLNAGVTGGTVDVFWDGVWVETLQVNGAVADRVSADFVGNGDTGELVLRISHETDLETGTHIAQTDATLRTADGVLQVAAFTAGQDHLYRLENGQLSVLSPDLQTAAPLSTAVGFGVSLASYDPVSNLIYGVAHEAGFDTTGSGVGEGDLVAIDADGQVLRVAETQTSNGVSAFDASGKLWVADASLDGATILDVSSIDPEGSIASSFVDFDNEMFEGTLANLSYNPTAQAFWGIEVQQDEQSALRLVQIDVGQFEANGNAVLSYMRLDGQLVDRVVQSGLPQGTVADLFFDATGSMYVTLAGSSAFAVYEIHTEASTGAAYLEWVREGAATAPGDLIVDPQTHTLFEGVGAQHHFSVIDFNISTSNGGEDSLRGASGDDQIFGGQGDDIVHGSQGNDHADGGAGADHLFGGDGNDVLDGGLNADHLEAGTGTDILFGGYGDDFLTGNSGRDRLDGGGGRDTAYGGDDADTLDLGVGHDFAFGGNGTDSVYGGSGDDHIDGYVGNDLVSGGAGNDFMNGGDGDDRMFGGAGDDVEYGGAGNDTIAAASGADLVSGHSGDDSLRGNAGDDLLFGGFGDDTLQGGGHDDVLDGGHGDDLLQGGHGNDRLTGGTGQDTISGGIGDDNMWGGLGDADVFVYSTGDGLDVVHDFELPIDQIDLTGFGISFSEVSDRTTDLGWATEIDLSDLSEENGIERIVIMSVDSSALNESHFIL